MPRLTAKDFPQELLDYYDYYAHGKISKREFLNLAAKYAVGGMTALALFDLLQAKLCAGDSGRVLPTRKLLQSTSRIPPPNGHGEVRGYLVKPAKNERQNASRGSGA
ncbi:hydrolase [Escherichia coli]|uniref:Hydrolase n=1 Tax=Escherichia coli TaxID=562 RepID=A0A484YTZ6_ECOLX|nr:hydrolase [Escherichia coli]